MQAADSAWTSLARLTPSRAAWLVLFAVLALLPLLPQPISTPFNLELACQVLTMAIFALSLQLLVGFTGLVSLGHAAYFGCGAYIVAAMTPSSDAGNGWLIVLASMAGAALLALVIGSLVMRTRGVYFIMVTLAFGQLAYFIVHDTAVFGGSDGTYVNLRPAFRLGSQWAMDLQKPEQFYWFTLGLFVFTVMALGLLLQSKFGHALVGIRHNEQRMRAAGFPTVSYKLASFVIAGAFGGLAGFLFAVRSGFVNPEILSWHQSGDALLMVILGGVGSLGGAVAGAVAFVLVSEWFQSLTKHWQLLFGAFIIVTVGLLPHGLAGGIRSLRLRTRRRANVHAPAGAAPEATP